MNNYQTMVVLTAAILLTACGGGDRAASSHAAASTNRAGIAQTLEFSTTISGARPEMLDWWWDNLDPDRFARWDEQAHVGFAWIEAPSTPQHLGASAGARYDSTEIIAGEARHLRTQWLSSTPGDADGSLLARVESDALGGYRLQHRYWASGEHGRDALVTTRIEFDRSPEAVLQRELQAHISQRLENLGSFLQAEFQTDFIETELRSRGSYRLETDGPITRVIVDQVIENLRPEHLNWWWDNIDTSARYRRWHPTAHVSFEWTRAPDNPDEEYDEHAAAEIVETLGPYTTRLEVARAPKAEAAEQAYLSDWVNLRTRLVGLQQNGLDLVLPVMLPDQGLVHQWGNSSMQLTVGPDGQQRLEMNSVFETPTYAPPGFHDGLGWHAIEEFQMLPYFLPRLYAQETGSKRSQ